MQADDSMRRNSLGPLMQEDGGATIDTMQQTGDSAEDCNDSLHRQISEPLQDHRSILPTSIELRRLDENNRMQNDRRSD